MATRISYQFPTRYGETYQVDLDDADHVGASLEVDAATDGFTLRYDGETDSVNPGIVGSSCSVSVLVTPDNKTAIETLASDIISSGEDRFTIAIYRITAGPTVSLYWAGYLVPDLGGFEDSSEGYFFTVKAVDGLARLKTLDYKDTTPDPDAPYGYDEFVDHIIRVINAVGTSALYWDATDVFLRTVVNWKDGNMPAPTAAKDPLKYSRISGGLFAKKATKDDGDAWDWTSYYTVLEQICRHWGARFMLSNGAWRFEQVRERMEENFFERRWANDNTLLSSTNAAGYDAPVIQTGSAHRLAGGQFNYLPALKKVEVNYDHKTYKNRLENLNYKWYKDSGSNTPFAETGMSFDADTYFRVRGNLFVNVSVSSYTEPWRYVFGIILKTTPGNYTLDSQTTAVGQGVPTLNRELPNWQVASVYYEVSTPWIYSTSYVGVIPNEFAFFTPYIPASQTGFSIDFSTGLGGRDYDGNNVSVTLNDWRFSNLELAIQGLDTAANYEKARSYTANNSTTGNSDAIKIDAIFGHAVKSWTPGKVQTTNDDTFVTWTDTTATWERANENTTYEFGDILAYQTLQLQLTPVQTYSGTLLSAGLHAHSRVTLADNTTWLINRGEWQARNNTWAVEMMLTGVADGADIDSDTPVGNPDDGGLLGTAPPGFNVAPGSGSGTLTAVGYEGRAALNFFTFSTISTHVGVGTITSIPVADPIKGNTIFDNDVIYVLDPQSGIVTKFVVNGNVADGATSITVDSQAINTPLPIGAQVIPSLYNIYTNSNGTGTSGTVSGSGTANHVAYWSSASALTGEAAFYYDPTNDRLGLNQSSPQKRLSIKTADATDGIRIESDGTLDQDVWGIEMEGTATGPYIQRGRISLDVFSNTGHSAYEVGQAIVFNMSTGAGSNFQPLAVYKNQLTLSFAGTYTLQGVGTGNRIRIESAGGIFSTANILLTNASYTTNDTTARLKLVGIGTTSPNFGLKIHDGSNSAYFYARDDKRIGVGVDPADAKVQIKGDGTGTAKTLLVENSSGTDNFYVQDNGLVTGQAFQNNTTAPTISYAAGAGTGPTTDILVGGNNCALLLFTTGTSPSASDTVFTLNLNKSFANGCVPSWVAYNAATQPIIGNFWLSGVGNNSITVKYAGTLAASTQYGLSITIMGY